MCTVGIFVHIAIAIQTVNVIQRNINRRFADIILHRLHIITEVVRAAVLTCSDLHRPEVIRISSRINVGIIVVENQPALHILMGGKIISRIESAGRNQAIDIQCLVFAIVHEILIVFRLIVSHRSEENFQDGVVVSILTPRRSRCACAALFIDSRTAIAERIIFAVIDIGDCITATAHEFAAVYKCSFFAAIDIGNSTGICTRNGSGNSTCNGGGVVSVGNGAVFGIRTGDAAYVGAAGDVACCTICIHDGVEDLIELARIRAGDATYVRAGACIHCAGIVSRSDFTAICAEKTGNILACPACKYAFRHSQFVFAFLFFGERTGSHGNHAVVVNLVFVGAVILITTTGDIAGVRTNKTAHLILTDDLPVNAVIHARIGNVRAVLSENTADIFPADDRSVIR